VIKHDRRSIGSDIHYLWPSQKSESTENYIIIHRGYAIYLVASFGSLAGLGFPSLPFSIDFSLLTSCSGDAVAG